MNLDLSKCDVETLLAALNTAINSEGHAIDARIVDGRNIDRATTDESRRFIAAMRRTQAKLRKALGA